MSPIGPERWEGGVSETIVLASGSVARVIPDGKANFRGLTSQLLIRLAEARTEGGGAPAGVSGLLSANVSGLPEGIRPGAGCS